MNWFMWYTHFFSFVFVWIRWLDKQRWNRAIEFHVIWLICEKLNRKKIRGNSNGLRIFYVDAIKRSEWIRKRARDYEIFAPQLYSFRWHRCVYSPLCINDFHLAACTFFLPFPRCIFIFCILLVSFVINGKWLTSNQSNRKQYRKICNCSENETQKKNECGPNEISRKIETQWSDS